MAAVRERSDRPAERVGSVRPDLLSGLLRFDLSPTFEAPGAARRAVVEALTARAYPPDLRDVAELLVSELVTNALQHAPGGVQLELSMCPPRTRVAVIDQSPAQPVVRHSGPDEVDGRGLLLVESLATDWGWQERRGGNQVWFELQG